MQVTSMKVGDLFPRPRLRLQADGVGVDLSEAVSVTARVRLPGSTSHVDRDVTVADQDVTANHGIVTVVLIDGDTDFQGTIKFDIEVEWATGVQTWPSRGYFKIWLLEDADSAQGGGPPLVGSSGDPFTLDRIYDVNISSVADNDLLQYDSTSARWLNVAPADVRSTLGLGSAALSSTTDFIRSSVTQAGAALTPTAQTLWSFQPADTNRGPFQWVMCGAAFDSVFDPVMYLGYNVTDGGGVAKSGEASFRTALESHYRNGGVNNFEYYFEYMSGDLVTRRRPFFLQMDKSTGAVNSMQFSANTAYFTQESDEAPYFTISRGNITSAPYAGTPIEWRIKAASAQNSVFTMENSTSVALTIETLTEDSAVLRAGSIANENLYLFNNRGIAVNVQDNAAALTVMGGAVGPVAVFRAGSVAGNLTTWQDNASSVLASVSAAGLATFAGVTLTDATNLVFGTSTGTRIGTATSQKLGFYNATPIIRPSGSILTALSNLGLVGSPTLASTALSDTANLAYLNVANTFAAAQFIDGSSDQIQLRVQGHSSQTADIFKVETSAGTKIGGWDQWGQLNTQYITDTTGVSPYFRFQTTSLMAINQGNAANVAFAVRGMASQSGALTLWQDSASTTLASISAAGAIKGASIGPVSASTFNILDNTGGAVATARTTDFLVNYRLIAGSTTGTEAFKSVGNSLLTVSNAAHIPVQVRGFTSQTANLQTWENSSATVLASISAAGAGTFNGVTVAAGYDINAAHAATGTTRYGVNAVNSVATGTGNSAFGYQAATSLTTGFSNVAMGYRALYVNTTGNYNTAIGHSTLLALASGDGNTALGWNALAAANGTTKNTAVGMWAQKVLASGNYNTTVGAESQYALNGGANNTSLGYGSLQGVTTGSGNIAIGYASGAYSTNQSYELFINSIDRTNRAGDIAGSIIYGVQSGTVANQTLALNASVTAEYGLRIGTNSGVLRLGTSGALYDRRAITNTYWGYSNSYRAILLGSASTNYNITDGASTIAINYDPSINAWAGFSGDGGEMIVRRGLTVCVPNSGDTSFKKTMTWRDGFVGINQTAPTSGLQIQPPDAASIGLRVLGFAAQTASLQTWENSSASVLASISAAGLGTFAGVASTTGTFSSDVSVGAGSAAVDSLLTINGGTNTGKGGAIAFKRGGSSKGYLGTRSFVIGGSTDDISLISYADLTLGIGSQILMAMSSSANTLNAYSSTAIPVVAKGFSAQTANLQEWQNSSGTALASVSSAGLGVFAGVTSTENVAVTKSQSATTRIAVTNGSTNANALAEIRAATDAGYTGLFKHPAAYGGYKILGASDAAIYNSPAGHISILNDVASGVIRFAAGGASSAQVQIETTGKLTTFTPTAAAASVRLPHGTAPTTPADGDMWTTDAGLYVHINGSTVGPLS